MTVQAVGLPGMMSLDTNFLIPALLDRLRPGWWYRWDWTFAGQDQGVAQILSAFEITGNIPQVEVKFEKTAVEAGTRRLGARWSVELEQDLKNMNGIDIDAEITNAMSYEIQAEIDREMLMRMIQAALGAGLEQRLLQSGHLLLQMVVGWSSVIGTSISVLSLKPIVLPYVTDVELLTLL
jgi:hypothetical protein